MTAADLEKVSTPQSFWGTFLRINSVCPRLARLNTLMAWTIFPAPAVYTIILYHCTEGAAALTPAQRVLGCMRLCLVMCLCVMSYRAAGLAWDDLIDRDFDAQVQRSMTRPIPAGEISVDGALLYILVQTVVTVVLLQVLSATEVSHAFMFSGAMFGIYPYLKRWTYYTQVFGALLISMGVIQGWLACATLYQPLANVTPGWYHGIALLLRDWRHVLPIFAMEFLYELAHELIYGCQDTAEDILLGLHSLSILCGYQRSRTLGTLLILAFTGMLAYCSWDAHIVAWPAALVPSLWLVLATHKLDLSMPARCGKWATSAIKVKGLITLLLLVSFLLQNIGSGKLLKGPCW